MVDIKVMAAAALLMLSIMPGAFAEDAAEPQSDALDHALGLIATSRGGFRVDPEAMVCADPTLFKSPIFDRWFCHPLRIPFWERHMRGNILAAKGATHKTFQEAASFINLSSARDLIDPAPLSICKGKAEKADSLKAAILALDPDAKVPDYSVVPQKVQRWAAAIVFAAAEAVKWRESALRRLTQAERRALYDAVEKDLKSISASQEEQKKEEENLNSAVICRESLDQADIVSKIDLQAFLVAGEDLAAVTDAAAAELGKEQILEKYEFACDTKFGRIFLSGGAANIYQPGLHYLLTIDSSGDDVYDCGGASDGEKYPIGIIIDLGGSDKYEMKGQGGSFGSGMLGWGILEDLAGNDSYRADGGYSQGCGFMGMGILYDGAGDDSYDSLASAQGFGCFGVGILIDKSGNDSYHAYCYAQGSALTLGAGLLADFEGDDRYTADDTDIRYPSAQSKEHNCSMAQGAASGERRDYLDNESGAGGVGMLLDAAGNDAYFGGVFSQAVGYWYGIGILDDRAGNDSYRSVWYGQSATAHFGISYLCDGGGNDLYTSTNCVNVAAAHDFSVSLFVEEGGDDRYEGASACGQALNNSVALFVDFAGNDSYAGGSLGSSTTFSETGTRSEILTRALFIDLDGEDKYPGGGKGEKGNNRSWIQKPEKPLPRLLGAGLDCTGLPFRWDIDPIP